MNPEDTDKFKSVEDVLYRLVDLPKKEREDLEKAEAAAKDPSDKSSDDSPKDSNT